jgi:CHRD domain-containing protein
MRRAAVLFMALALVAGCDDSNDNPAGPSTTGPIVFTSQLTAASEVPPVTGVEANGRGNVTISFNVPRDTGGAVVGAGTASFAIQLSGFPPGTPAILAHIHPGATGVNGAPLVNTNLAPATALVLGDGTVNVTLTAPVSQVDAAAITANPAAYYFNVHTQLNPGGAVRGQLVRTQ